MTRPTPAPTITRGNHPSTLASLALHRSRQRAEAGLRRLTTIDTPIPSALKDDLLRAVIALPTAEATPSKTA